MTGSPDRRAGAAPCVTALRSRGRDRVEVELDDLPWRVVPVGAAVEAGLGLGLAVDRERARALNRALRRHRAEVVAVRALGYADHTRAGLDERLARHGIAPAARAATVERAARAGLVDDVRFARSRAESLARRRLGNAAILADLEARGVETATARAAMDTLGAEDERARAIVARRGASAKTARYLAGRGFGADTVEAAIADVSEDGLG